MSVREAQGNVAGAARGLKEIEVPVTHGFARYVNNHTINEPHWILNRLDEAVNFNAGEQWLRASLRTTQSTAGLCASLWSAQASILQMNFCLSARKKLLRWCPIGMGEKFHE